jgi:hypothetical protein
LWRRAFGAITVLLLGALSASLAAPASAGAVAARRPEGPFPGDHYFAADAARGANGSNFVVFSHSNESEAIFGVAGAIVKGGHVIKRVTFNSVLGDVAVAYDAGSDRWLVTWNSTSDLVGALYDGTGTRVGSKFTIHKGGGQFPDVSASKGKFLVAWSDSDNVSKTWIAASVVTTTGTVMSPAGNKLSSASTTDKGPVALASGPNGTWMAVWSEYRTSTFDDVLGTRVSASGTAVNPGGKTIAATNDGESNPSIAFSGSEFLVAYTASNSTRNRIVGTRLATDGTVKAPGALQINAATIYVDDAAVNFNNGAYEVVWTEPLNAHDENILGTAVPVGSGGPASPSGVTIAAKPHEQSEPAIALLGTSFLVVWDDNRDGTNTHVFGISLDPINPNGFRISP